MNNEDEAPGIYIKAQMAFCVIFIVLLGMFSIINLFTQGSFVFYSLAGALNRSSGLQEIRFNISEFEKTMGRTLPAGNNFIEIYAYIQKLLGKEETDNFWVVRDKNGGLSYANFYPDDIMDMEECARRLWRLQETVKPHGTKVFFVNPPAHYIQDHFQYSPGLPYADQNFLQDSFLYHLQLLGIDFLDLRTGFSRHPESDPKDFFFHTDHHWRTEIAFTAFTEIVSWMNRTYNTGFDPEGFYRNSDNYLFKTYPQASLGSMGRAVGVNFSGLDDFTVIIPKFGNSAEFTFEPRFLETNRPEPRRGPLNEVLLYPEFLRTKNPYNTDFYAFYQGGIKPADRIINNSLPDGSKVLLIHDSYMLPISVFLSPLFGEIQMIWAANDVYKTVIDSYLQENIFDFIIVMMYQGNLKLDSFYYFAEPLEAGLR